MQGPLLNLECVEDEVVFLLKECERVVQEVLVKLLEI